MSDGYTPIRGKCTWWRERPVEEDKYERRIKEEDRRVTCSCFLEGQVWTYRQAEVPVDCPFSLHCRYWIRHY